MCPLSINPSLYDFWEWRGKKLFGFYVFVWDADVRNEAAATQIQKCEQTKINITKQTSKAVGSSPHMPQQTPPKAYPSTRCHVRPLLCFRLRKSSLVERLEIRSFSLDWSPPYLEGLFVAVAVHSCLVNAPRTKRDRGINSLPHLVSEQQQKQDSPSAAHNHVWTRGRGST